MSANQQSIKLQIKAFDENSPAKDTDTPPAADPRVEEFMTLLRAKVAALDVEQREKWAANVPKVSHRKTAAPPVTPDWYETGVIKEPKAKASGKQRLSKHPYPGRRTNKPKTP